MLKVYSIYRNPHSNVESQNLLQPNMIQFMRHTKFIKMAMRKTHAQHQERNKIADMAIYEHIDEFIARSIGWSVELQGVTVM